MSNYQRIYYAYVANRNGGEFRADIFKKTDSTVTEKELDLSGDNPITIQWEEQDELFTTLHMSSLTMNVLTNQPQTFSDIFTGGVNDFTIKLWYKSGTNSWTLIYFGFLKPLIWSSDFNIGNNILSLTFVDALSQLENVRYQKSGTMIRTFLDYITEGLNKVDTQRTISNIYVQQEAWDQYTLDNLAVSENNWLDDDSEDDNSTYQDIICYLVKYCNCVCFTVAQAVYCYNPMTVRDTKKFYRYMYNGTGWALSSTTPSTINKYTIPIENVGVFDADATIALGDMYEQIKVIGSNKEIESEPVSDFIEDEHLVNITTNYVSRWANVKRYYIKNENAEEAKDRTTYTLYNSVYRSDLVDYDKTTNGGKFLFLKEYETPTDDETEKTYVSCLNNYDLDSVDGFVGIQKYDDYETKEGASKLSSNSCITFYTREITNINQYGQVTTTSDALSKLEYVGNKSYITLKSKNPVAFGANGYLIFNLKYHRSPVKTPRANTCYELPEKFGYYYSRDDDDYIQPDEEDVYFSKTDDFQISIKIGDKYYGAYGWSDNEYPKTVKHTNSSGDSIWFHSVELDNNVTETLGLDAENGVLIPLPDYALSGDMEVTIYAPTTFGRRLQWSKNHNSQMGDVYGTQYSESYQQWQGQAVLIAGCQPWRGLHIEEVTLQYTTKTNVTDLFEIGDYSTDTEYSNEVDSDNIQTYEDDSWKVNTFSDYLASQSFVFTKSDNSWVYSQEWGQFIPENRRVAMLYEYFQTPRYKYGNNIQTRLPLTYGDLGITGTMSGAINPVLCNFYYILPFTCVYVDVLGKYFLCNGVSYNLQKDYASITANEYVAYDDDEYTQDSETENTQSGTTDMSGSGDTGGGDTGGGESGGSESGGDDVDDTKGWFYLTLHNSLGITTTFTYLKLTMTLNGVDKEFVFYNIDTDRLLLDDQNIPYTGSNDSSASPKGVDVGVYTFKSVEFHSMDSEFNSSGDNYYQPCIGMYTTDTMTMTVRALQNSYFCLEIQSYHTTNS